MVKCPTCKKELGRAQKTWNYGVFKVQAYACECGTEFREYARNDKHVFTLKKNRKGVSWKKV